MTSDSDGRRPIVFLVLVSALSLPFFLLGALFGSVQVGAMKLPASAVMFVLPVVAAALLVHRAAGWAGVVRLLRRVVDRPAAQARWYAVAVLIPVGVAVAAHLIARATGQVGSALPLSLVAVPVLVLAAVVAASCEELGWTAYATDPLQQRWGAAVTGLLLGIFWGIWHLIPLLQAGHSGPWLLGWFAGTVAARVIIVYLHNATNGGGSTAIVLHAMLNVTAALTPDYDNAISPILAGALTVVIAVALTIRRPGVHRDSHLDKAPQPQQHSAC